LIFIELRVWGLKIIDQVLTMFGKTPDPDFAEASLLEVTIPVAMKVADTLMASEASSADESAAKAGVSADPHGENLEVFGAGPGELFEEPGDY
jgi:hypothetical protein